ncbi:M15 family metallopeptidase [Paenisporosarcina sp. NPDC076898]
MLTAFLNRINENEDSVNVPLGTEETTPNLDPTPPSSLQRYNENLEFPTTGATGYTSIALDLKTFGNTDSRTIKTFKAGTAFEILAEQGDWWFIKNADSTGWIQHTYCLINLPDVIPSIIYDNTNTYSSKYMSSGKSIPNITGKSLYSSKSFNKRLGKEEFIVPVLYSMSKKIFLAQQEALADGNSLIIHEGYRPYPVQQSVVSELTKLANKDSEVKAGISAEPWGVNWFIATSVSNHQMGYAIDASLAKIHATTEIVIGEYVGIEITDYTEYEMPTKIHELSVAAVAFTAPVKSTIPMAWKNSVIAETMNEPAIKLQTYATNAGLSPLASEWWHFNDLDAMKATMEKSSDGNYFLIDSYSTSPSN